MVELVISIFDGSCHTSLVGTPTLIQWELEALDDKSAIGQLVRLLLEEAKKNAS